jgi:hypothetical protein
VFAFAPASIFIMAERADSQSSKEIGVIGEPIKETPKSLDCIHMLITLYKQIEASPLN